MVGSAGAASVHLISEFADTGWMDSTGIAWLGCPGTISIGSINTVWADSSGTVWIGCGSRCLAVERPPPLDCGAARALPRLMLVTGNEHRGVFDHLNQAHLCTALQAQHCSNLRKSAATQYLRVEFGQP